MVNVWTTALALGRPRPTWVTDPMDADRVQAYGTYWDLYRNLPEAYAVVLRDDAGEEISRRYVPGARQIVEATNNYLGRDFRWVVDQSSSNGVALQAELDKLFAREKFRAKFNSVKRWSLVRGDGLLHLTADMTKPAGSRISIHEISPERYFPIWDPTDSERVVGCYLVEMMEVDDEAVVSRLLYRRILSDEDAATYGVPIGSVFTQLTFWEPDGWDDRETDEDLKPVGTPSVYNNEAMQEVLAGKALPPQITSIPVYHIRNNYSATEPFGVSELQGLESMITGLTQTMTDEELALALQALGVYWTDSGSPMDEDGNEAGWIISPASVLELESGKSFGRVQGVTDVKPYQDHKDALKAEMRESSGISAVAVGQVEVQASGISLEIQFRPLTSKNAEKEDELKGVLNQILYDICNGWLPAYEQVTLSTPDQPTPVVASFGDPLPVDRAAVLTEVIQMVTARIIDGETARQMLTERLGMAFPAGVGAAIAAEQQTLLDPTAGRIDAEAGATDDLAAAE
jgi:hypothetical protein